MAPLYSVACPYRSIAFSLAAIQGRRERSISGEALEAASSGASVNQAGALSVLLLRIGAGVELRHALRSNEANIADPVYERQSGIPYFSRMPYMLNSTLITRN
jgi:hypothetical protein